MREVGKIDLHERSHLSGFNSEDNEGGTFSLPFPFPSSFSFSRSSQSTCHSILAHHCGRTRKKIIKIYYIYIHTFIPCIHIPFLVSIYRFAFDSFVDMDIPRNPSGESHLHAETAYGAALDDLSQTPSSMPRSFTEHVGDFVGSYSRTSLAHMASTVPIASSPGTLHSKQSFVVSHIYFSLLSIMHVLKSSSCLLG